MECKNRSLSSKIKNSLAHSSWVEETELPAAAAAGGFVVELEERNCRQL